MQKLVQIPSFSGDEEEIGQFLLDEIKKIELDDLRIEQKTLDRPNVMARYRGTVGNPSITTYAHYYTVPLGDVTKWVHGPFSGTIEDGKIFGRGVSDHKFPIPPLLFAVKAIKKAGLKLKGDIVFAFVCDEERGGHQGMRARNRLNPGLPIVETIQSSGFPLLIRCCSKSKIIAI